MRKEEIHLKVRRSRKSYFPYYLVAIIIIGILLSFYFMKIEIPAALLIAALILVALIIKFIEIHRMRNWWAITDSSFIESRGILNKNIREIDFDSISDIDLNQTFHKRVLGYGTVNIRRFLNETIISINNINNPERFVNVIQDAIRSKKGRVQ
ncbi:MAG: PH domain-containing protein [archaeon]|nr:PH domain-containing protein [archaeon]